jgi:two-component system phosphate regulon response regulator PhoB
MTVTIPSILFIEPDESFMTVMSYNLERRGFVVNAVKDTNLALHSVDRVVPHLVILNDETSGSFSADEMCSILRNKNSTSNVPVILLSKNGDNAQTFSKNHPNVVSSLIKPFATSALISAVKSLFTNSNNTTTLMKGMQTLEYKNLKMNVGSYRVTRNGETIHLGPTEFRILQCFMQLPSKVLSREEIIIHVWGYKSQIDPRTIDVHINRLRSALNNDNAIMNMGQNDNTPSIRTVRSMGYSLN